MLVILVVEPTNVCPLGPVQLRQAKPILCVWLLVNPALPTFGPGSNFKALAMLLRTVMLTISSPEPESHGLSLHFFLPDWKATQHG